MPLYDLECLECGHRFECTLQDGNAEEQLCAKCNDGVDARLIFPMKSASLSLFRPGFYEHVGEGVWADTPQQLQDACNEHGSYSAYLENSVFNVKRDYDGHAEREQRAREQR